MNSLEESSPKVGCVIVNWNGWQDTIYCLRALNMVSYQNLEIIVVDNGSTNDSAEQIREAFPELVLIVSGTNLGFAGGNNLGIRYAIDRGVEFVWLLNNDTQPHPDALSTLVSKAQSDSRIGAVASVCYYATKPSRVQVWAGARANLWIGYVRNAVSPRPDGWFHALYGASLLLASGALKEAGLLDEGFFLYWEETELCLRLRKLGWLLAAAPDSRVLHKVSSSTKGDRMVIDRYFTASGLRILRLHSPWPSLAMALFLAIRFVRRIARLQFSSCGRVWAGIQDYRRKLPIVPMIG